MTNETIFLLETLTKNLVLKVMEEFGYSITEAMDVVYHSQIYDKILDLETGTPVDIIRNHQNLNPRLRKRILKDGIFIF